MSKKPLVSVIIVNYNGKKFVGECIGSVLASDYPNFEIVVVDNASTDGSYEYLQKIYGKNRKVKLIKSNQQLYFTGGSNLGAKNASGEKLIFLNNDTVVDKDWIQELLNFAGDKKKYLVQPKILKYHPPSLNLPAGEAGLRGAGEDTVDNAGGRYVFPGFGLGIGHSEVDHGQYDKNNQVDFVNGTCFMIDKDFFWQLGGFDETFHFFYEDVDLCLRAKKAGGQCFFCGKSIIYHHGGKTFKENLAPQALTPYIKKNRRQTIEKNFTGLNKATRLATLLLIEHTQKLFSHFRN